MSILKTLSYLGGYFNSKEFELDIPKIADVAELSEEDLEKELQELQSKGIIDRVNNNITLIGIEPKKNKIFNDTYAPVETMNWDKHVMLKLDK